MGKKFVAFIILIFLVACTEEPVIVKSDSSPEDPDQEPEIVEQENDDKEEVEAFIEFTLPEEEIMINLKMVPILDSYLQAAENRWQAIAEMTLEPIITADKDLYLLEFSCQEKLCSYLLLDRTEEKNKAYLIADLAELFQKTISPDDTKVLFHFNREQSSHLPYSDFTVIDLEKWELIPLDIHEEEQVMLDYTWPILNVEWIGNNNLSVTIPDIAEPTPENIKQWQDTEKPTTMVEFTLNTNK
ncbi:hypothetical protein SAMN04488072_11824 [Lentibacillus halodurans]|uniref:Uncharacterized protein n=1 Tax=Lentibacillus halodurans TaxID=237679 RepID=A0A1I1AB92_9BACI|nr:hypothetical protein [Lentibacillus halodurans]SFB35227.1 hypothetical protein SAMN04488072_11824 [Lentibacillus halodurans]